MGCGQLRRGDTPRWMRLGVRPCRQAWASPQSTAAAAELPSRAGPAAEAPPAGFFFFAVPNGSFPQRSASCRCLRARGRGAGGRQGWAGGCIGQGGGCAQGRAEMFGVVAAGTPGAQTHRDGGWQHSEEPHGALSPVPQRHGGDQGVKQPLGSPNPKGGSGVFGSPPGPIGAAGFPPPFWGSLSLLGLPPHLGAPPSSSFVQLSPPASPSMGSIGGLLPDPPSTSPSRVGTGTAPQHGRSRRERRGPVPCSRAPGALQPRCRVATGGVCGGALLQPPPP